MLAFFRSVTTFRKRVQLGILLSTIGFVIWVYLVLTTRVWWIAPEFPLGLLQVLPLWFWIALVLHLAGILLTFDYENLTIFLLQIIFLNLIIVGTAVLVEPNARVNDTWLNFGTTKTILDSGRITIKDSPSYWLIQYPFAFIFTAIIVGITGIPQTAFMQFFPVLSSTLFLLGYYVWMRELLPNTMCQKFCMIMLFLLNLWLRFHLDPQAFALMVLPLVLLAFNKDGGTWKTVAIILSISLIVFHPLTSGFLILLFTIECTILYLLGKKPNYVRPLFLFVLWFSWLSFYAVIYFERWIVLRSVQNLLNFPLLNSTLLESQAQHNILPSMMRLSVVAVTSIFVAWNIWQTRTDIRKSNTIYVAWLASSVVIGVVDTFVFQSEFQDRFFAFAMLACPILIATFVWKRRKNMKRVLILLFLLMGLMNLSTLYYYENYWIISDSALSSARFASTYGYSHTIYGHRVETMQYYNTDIDVKDVFRFWDSSDKLVRGSIIVYDDYTNSSKYGPYLQELTSLYFGKEGDDVIYDNGPFKVHTTLLP